MRLAYGVNESHASHHLELTTYCFSQFGTKLILVRYRFISLYFGLSMKTSRNRISLEACPDSLRAVPVCSVLQIESIHLDDTLLYF